MAGEQIAEPQVADANTDKTFHFVIDFVKHAADLPVDTLSQDNAQAFRTA